jgi:hypothetical protein
LLKPVAVSRSRPDIEHDVPPVGLWLMQDLYEEDAGVPH